MKSKAFAGIMTLLMITTALSVFPVPTSAQSDVIHVGVIGPVGWPQFDGMQRGAEIAADWINDMGPGGGGGIKVGGTIYTVELHYGDEHASDMNPGEGAAEMERLIVTEGCKFVVGGYRDECVMAMREVACAYTTPFFICHAPVNELIDCGTCPGGCGACVRCDYARYRYVFRVAFNETTLLLNIRGFLRDVPRMSLLPLMASMFGDPVSTAVIAENLVWADDLYNAFVYGGYLGPQANIVYATRTPYGETNFVPYLDDMHATEVRLIIVLFSAPDSITFMQQYAAHPIKAVPVGIDVLGQFQGHWTATAGGCEYEAFLAKASGRAPICPEVNPGCEPYTTQEFQDIYVATYGATPIDTSYNVYDTIIALKETLEQANDDGYALCIKPYLDCTTDDATCLIPFIEQTDHNGTVGRLKYTGQGPHDCLSEADYNSFVCGDCGLTYLSINPTMNGTLHDVYSNEYLHEWSKGFKRPLMVQWQAQKIEVIWPKYKTAPTLLSFWKRFLFPPRMYADVSDAHRCDLTYDGLVDMRDISLAARAFGSYPCHPRYDRGAAIIIDDHPPGYEDEPVTMRDISAIARRFGTQCIPYPVPYDP